QAAGARARRLRPHPRALHPVRAARRLRALDEDQAVPLDVPALQARHVQASEGLHAVGAPPMSFFEARDLPINFGGLQALDGVSDEVELGRVSTIIGPDG